MIALKFSLFSTGYCTGLEKLVNKRGSHFKKCSFPATFALIEHPQKGNILYDTGYSSSLYQACQKFPFQLYPLTTPITLENSAKEMVPDDIKTIIISHFHADHICGLKDFPKADFIYLEDAWDDVKGLTGFKALKKAFIPSLIPDDFEKRSRQVSLDACTYPTGLGPFDYGIDLFGDGSLIGIPLPGHAKGQMGLFFHTKQDGPIFFVADACWQQHQIELKEMPHWITTFILDDTAAFKTTLNNLHTLSKNRPDVKIVPTHCASTHKEVSCFSLS